MHTPDRAIVQALQRIDKDLSVSWSDPPGRWAIWYALQVDGNFDESVGRLARELQLDAARCGYTFDLSECAHTAAEAVKVRSLVCYVTDDDGGYRSLDGRIVQKLERMDFYRRNCGVKDWKSMMEARADALRQSRRTAEGDIWDTIRRDRVFARHASDILWGVRPVRSIIVPEGGFDATDRERDVTPDAGQGTGQEAHGNRGDGISVAVPEPPDSTP
jgi:hypothetical protein